MITSVGLQAQLETQLKAINQHFAELLQTGEEPEYKGEFSTPTWAIKARNRPPGQSVVFGTGTHRWGFGLPV